MGQHVLFEIGLEEMPARFIDQAESQLLDKTKKWLDEQRISYSGVTSFSTPRRLAVRIENIADRQEDINEEAKGPAMKIAKDDAGNWTKAAIGFTRGQGKTVDDIYTKEIKGVSYIFVKKQIIGKETMELLPSFKDVILSLQFGKNMRWGEEKLRFIRPIRWLVALYGERTIPFEIAHVKTGNTTYGHRFLGEKITLVQPQDYEKMLNEQYVIVEPKKREQLIIDGIHALENNQGFHVSIDDSLLREVRNLVEYPTVFVGSFEKEFLEVPSEVLITSMKEHQRYFPVFDDRDRKLLPHFIGVRNGDSNHLETVIRGNEKVLRARLSDAKFFFDTDQKQDIAFYQRKLANVVFQEKLGTIQDKVDRVVKITELICEKIACDEKTTKQAIRAAEICKFDLVTNMVNEFTDLQGIMGEKYARIFGEEEAVCKAVGEQYLPDHAEGELPQSLIGSILSVADKLDTIAGSIYAGLRPTGSQDPYGLRRQALGILRILENTKWHVAVEDLFQMAGELFASSAIEGLDAADFEKELHDFIQKRANYLLKEAGISSDVIQAVTGNGIGEFPYAMQKAVILSEKRNDEAFKLTQEALSRVLNLAEKGQVGTVDEGRLETESEKILYDTFQQLKKEFVEANDSNDAMAVLRVLEQLALPIHSFFDNNMVMAKDEKLKQNRLTLLANMSQMIHSFADFSAIAWKQQN
ncbi:glycine--tRNA ligase subunit beta [Virgibacillus sp. 179-BFC.A HS]|uniref:Glycine--tRNA ligase beta subunit n=1 Tax=Tigheibacillus jepli TaxID=3035914 RepID=A0ABU5CGU4_9BACI|nr:glycine--tRNA ligase subunit beta [Virgibacillus sp. 179-BFC.A HS]MDY0405546.1 glycine--tRNA ligase subunit beta [Virgibacillus sp. 179-BFC.A HS]